MKLRSIDLRCENEIAFRQPIDLVRPDFYLNLSPTEEDIGMVSLLFGDVSDFVDEIEGSPEVGEFEVSLNMVIVNDGPIFQLRLQRLDLICSQRRYTATTRDTGFLCETGHDHSPPLPVILEQ